MSFSEAALLPLLTAPPAANKLHLDCSRDRLLFVSRSRLAAIMDHDFSDLVIVRGQIST